MANSSQSMKLGPCDSRIEAEDGTLYCSEVGTLAQLATDKCQVGADACRHCLTLPKRPNSVIASMASRAAYLHLPQEDATRIHNEVVRPLLDVNRPAKRATAEDFPCVHRGDLTRKVDCELCGDRGSLVEVYECFGVPRMSPFESVECTIGRWTNQRKEPTQTCINCTHRSELTQLDVVNLALPVGQPRSTLTATPKKPCKLTIGMACYDDEPGVFFTVQSILMYHANVIEETNAEILIVDANPGKYIKADTGRITGIEGSKHGAEVREFCVNYSENILRYIPAGFAKGTSAPRDLIFREAKGEIVLCVDCHVMLVPEALRALVDHFTENPDSIDLIQGPMLGHNRRIYATHMRREWGSDLMLGKWETDPQIWDLDNSPFEIEGHGMGLFACRKLAWRGFNPAFQGFGGEEIQYHDKVRAAGGKCLCLPQLQWLHKFSRVDGVPYPLRLEDRFRNYLIGHMELGKDITEVLQRFAGRIPQESYGRIVAEVMKVFDSEMKADEVAA